MGRFGAPYGKEQLTNLLRRLGNRVVTKMGPGVDTVILGNDPVNEAGDGFASIRTATSSSSPTASRRVHLPAQDRRPGEAVGPTGSSHPSRRPSRPPVWFWGAWTVLISAARHAARPAQDQRRDRPAGAAADDVRGPPRRARASGSSRRCSRSRAPSCWCCRSRAPCRRSSSVPTAPSGRSASRTGSPGCKRSRTPARSATTPRSSWRSASRARTRSSAAPTSPHLLQSKTGYPVPYSLYATGGLEDILSFMWASLIFALVLASPVVIWQIWAFIAAGSTSTSARSSTATSRSWCC